MRLICTECGYAHETNFAVSARSIALTSTIHPYLRQCAEQKNATKKRFKDNKSSSECSPAIAFSNSICTGFITNSPPLLKHNAAKRNIKYADLQMSMYYSLAT